MSEAGGNVHAAGRGLGRLGWGGWRLRRPLTTHCLLLTTHYSLLTTHYQLLTTHRRGWRRRPGRPTRAPR
eukprot:scaffold113129_cov48-Phaeocystis_antarctica.AAC.1